MSAGYSDEQSLRVVEHIEQLRTQIKELQAEVERLRTELAKADDHPVVMEQGGTSGSDRCHRVINKLCAPEWYWDEADREYAHASIEECLESYEAGEIAKLRPLHELPPIWVCVTVDGYSVHDTKEAAEAATSQGEDTDD